MPFSPLSVGEMCVLAGFGFVDTLHLARKFLSTPSLSWFVFCHHIEVLSQHLYWLFVPACHTGILWALVCFVLKKSIFEL